MDIQSIEDSLAMLESSQDTPSRSPMSIPTKRKNRKTRNNKDIDASEEDIFEILKSEDDLSPSPPTLKSDDEEEEDDEEDDEEEEEEEEDDEEEEEEDDEEEEEEEVEEDEEEEDDEEEEEDEDEEEEVEMSSSPKKILPITPRKFTVSTPRTPVEKLQKKRKGGKGSPGSFLSKLKDARYSILRIIYVDNVLKYIVCYDPYGQIVFVLCEDEEIDIKSVNDSVDIVKLITVPETKDNPLDEAFVNAVKDNVNMAVFGIIFYNGEDYQISERNSKGFFKDKYCRKKGKYDKQKLSFPQTFIVVQSEDLFIEPLSVIEDNKENYEYIQIQQAVTSRQTFAEIKDSLKSLNDTMSNFETSYTEHSRRILKDWKIMGKHSKVFYQDYIDGNLSVEKKKEYDLVTLNMFLRFQFFNQNIELADKLSEIKEYFDKANHVLSKAIDEIIDKDENVSTKIVSQEEFNRYI